jgi:hypothetical protein
MPAHLPRLNRRVLTVFLFISLPILALGVALVLAIGQARLTDAAGRHLEDVALQTAASVDAYVFRSILDVSLLGRGPDLRRDAAAASARPVDQAAIEAADRGWVQRTAALPEKTAILRSPTSRYLADLVAQDRVYREMLLTDRAGRLVAASGETSDYFQGDEDWWKAAAGNGSAPRASVSDVRWDESTRTHAIEIAVPVVGPDSSEFVGVFKAVVDSRELLAAVGGVQLGTTGEAVLLRRNGTIVFSRATADPNARYVAADTLAERLAVPPEGDQLSGASFRFTPAIGTTRVVGLAPSQLARSYPNLGWVVAVSQAEDELLQPVRMIGWYLLAVFALTAIGILLAATWFSVRLAAPQVEEDLVLVEHAPVSHVGEEEREELGAAPESKSTNVRLAG